MCSSCESGPPGSASSPWRAWSTVRTEPGETQRAFLGYLASFPGRPRGELEGTSAFGLYGVEDLIRGGYVREDGPERRLYLTAAGQLAAGRPGHAAGAAGAGPARGLGAEVGELLRGGGRVTVGGCEYRVVVPASGRGRPDLVYLRRGDGRVFAVPLEAHVREVDPGDMEAGL